MEIVFLILLLAVVVWLNRGVFGFGATSCDWMKADTPQDDGSWKMMCTACGAIETTADGHPPSACRRKQSGSTLQ